VCIVSFSCEWQRQTLQLNLSVPLFRGKAMPRVVAHAFAGPQVQHRQDRTVSAIITPHSPLSAHVHQHCSHKAWRGQKRHEPDVLRSKDLQKEPESSSAEMTQPVQKSGGQEEHARRRRSLKELRQFAGILVLAKICLPFFLIICLCWPSAAFEERDRGSKQGPHSCRRRIIAGSEGMADLCDPRKAAQVLDFQERLLSCPICRFPNLWTAI